MFFIFFYDRELQILNISYLLKCFFLYFADHQCAARSSSASPLSSPSRRDSTANMVHLRPSKSMMQHHRRILTTHHHDDMKIIFSSATTTPSHTERISQHVPSTLPYDNLNRRLSIFVPEANVIRHSTSPDGPTSTTSTTSSTIMNSTSRIISITTNTQDSPFSPSFNRSLGRLSQSSNISNNNSPERHCSSHCLYSRTKNCNYTKSNSIPNNCCLELNSLRCSSIGPSCIVVPLEQRCRCCRLHNSKQHQSTICSSSAYHKQSIPGATSSSCHISPMVVPDRTYNTNRLLPCTGNKNAVNTSTVSNDPSVNVNPTQVRSPVDTVIISDDTQQKCVTYTTSETNLRRKLIQSWKRRSLMSELSNVILPSKISGFVASQGLSFVLSALLLLSVLPNVVGEYKSQHFSTYI